MKLHTNQYQYAVTPVKNLCRIVLWDSVHYSITLYKYPHITVKMVLLSCKVWNTAYVIRVFVHLRQTAHWALREVVENVKFNKLHQSFRRKFKKQKRELYLNNKNNYWRTLNGHNKRCKNPFRSRKS